MARVVEVELELDRVTPRVWRRVRLHASRPLSDLHRTIQVLMGWGDYHLHVFEVGLREYAPRTLDEDDEPDEPDRWAGDDREISIGDAFELAGSALSYVYDFDDEWRVRIALTAAAAAHAAPYPECVDGQLAGPPEGSGGPDAHQRRLSGWPSPEAVSARDTAWPDDYDPLAFDVDDANRRLAEEFGEPSPRRAVAAGQERLRSDLTLLVLYLGATRERNGAVVSSKALRVDVLEALARAGWLTTNPHRKSVVLTDLGVRRAEALRARVSRLVDAGDPR